MTPYRFDNQERKQTASRTKIIVGAFAAIAVILFIVFILAPIIRTIARGPQWMRMAVTEGITDTISSITPKKTIIAHNEKLHAENESLRVQLFELQMLRDENESLRQELSYVKNPNETMLAGILAKPSQSLYNSLIIDRGSNDGVQVGSIVLSQGTILLGRVSSVTNKTATVELISGPHFDGSLVMKGETNITVPALGKGGGNFEIHIPREITVVDGGILALPEHPDYAVGVIKSVQFDPRDPYQTVLARVPVNIQELKFVEVVK